MKQYEQNITFELNEKLSFETGQEIEEMISISIDPDIVIQAYKEHVQIRGIILLAGEYHRRRENFNQLHPRQKQGSVRYIEKVVNLDDHVAGFSHRFPVDIAVAKDRVENIEDIVVTVDSFDYELPSANILNVTASLHIHGILAEKKQELEKELTEKEDPTKITENEHDQLRDETFKDKDIQSEKFAISEQKNINQERSLRLVKNEPGENEGITKKEKTDQNINLTPEVSESSSKDKIEEETYDQNAKAAISETDSKVEKREKQSTKNELKNEIENEPENEAKTEETSGTKMETKQRDEKDQTTDEHAMHIELSESAEDDDEDVKDVTFLTELFEEEEETYTQVTIYIAQEDDSIESIAKRYEIPVLQLLKDNNMSADTIEAGQLITIRQRTIS